MTRKLLALAAGALAVLLISSTFDTADAKGRGGWGGGGGKFYGGGGGHARSFGGARFYGGGSGSYRAYSFAGPRIHRHRHFRRGIAVGVPLAAYGAYYYTSSCDWLRRKAYYTGSGYWMDRYYACLDGYY
jgi:hypothetical protein